MGGESQGGERNKRDRKGEGKVQRPEQDTDGEGNSDEKVLGLRESRQRERERKVKKMFCRKTTFLLQAAKIHCREGR